MNGLRGHDDPQAERETARALAALLKGIGPKQSRNLLQTLGVTKYEIPIDSRITGWLNRLGVYPKLGAGALADSALYELVMDGLAGVCKQAGVYPCVFDAAVFASFEQPDAYDAGVHVW